GSARGPSGPGASTRRPGRGRRSTAGPSGGPARASEIALPVARQPQTPALPPMNRLIAEYGLALVFANVLLEQLGLPIPAVPALVVAGALAAEGVLSPLAVFGVAFVACMIGDAIWFLAGRRYGRRVMAFLCRVSLSPDSCVRQTEFRFERWGRLTLVLSKFIPGLSTIAPPLAGAMRLGWPSFLLLNGLGVVIWAGVVIGAGMAFHTEINEFIVRLEGLGTLTAEALGVLLGGYIALKWWERRRFYK